MIAYCACKYCVLYTKTFSAMGNGSLVDITVLVTAAGPCVNNGKDGVEVPPTETDNGTADTAGVAVPPTDKGTADAVGAAFPPTSNGKDDAAGVEVPPTDNGTADAVDVAVAVIVLLMQLML